MKSRVLAALAERDDVPRGREIPWLVTATELPDSTIRDALKRGPGRPDVAIRIARATGLDLEYMLTGERRTREALHDEIRQSLRRSAGAERPDLVEVNEIDLTYGLGATFVDNPVEATTRSFSRAWLRNFTDSPPEELFWARGQGDSMEKTIHDNDIVLIDRRQNTPRMSDLIWAFAFGHVGMIKRLRPMPDGSVKILSDNPAVPPESAVDGELHIIGRVVAVVKRV